MSPQPSRTPNRQATLSALTEGDISRIVEMAWEDRTAFEAIERIGGN